MCLVPVDGTDFCINEPKPFWPGWESFKFNGPGVHYEATLYICTGVVVWINGPNPCGKWPDLKILRNTLMGELLVGEKGEVDLGYRDEILLINKIHFSSVRVEKGRKIWHMHVMKQ